MTKFEFCQRVLTHFGNWPFAGSLAMAAQLYDEKKTVEQAIAEITAKTAKKRKKQH